MIGELNRMLYADIMAAAVPLLVIFQELFPCGHEPHDEVWPVLCNNPTNFWHLTGETIESLTAFTQPITTLI